MGYYITKTGKIVKEGRNIEPMDTSKWSIVNWFYTLESAFAFREALEKWNPSIFYGKRKY